MSYKKANGKKFIGIFICAVAILIAGCIAVPFFSKEEGYRMITVFEVSGTVGVVKDGIEYEAYPGMHLQEGHVIVTSENSYARLVLDDDKYVKVEAGSRLEFETLGLLGTNKTRLKLDRGAITTEIVNPLGADEEYVVNTPNAVLAVRGTFFRVDLRVTKNGEIDTNVYTYGGKVASNRVMPTGEMVEEEVIVDAGFMTAIRMDALETIYIVGMAESPTGEPVEETKKNTVPIEPGVIPDDDLVDMYFASENGHEMFLSTDEIKENIEEREISIEEQAPVYDRANEVKEQEESNTENTTSMALIPDDRGDWEEDTEVAVEETDEPQQEVVEDVQIEEDVVVEVEDEVVPEEVVQETPEQVVVTPVVPPASTEEPETEEPHSHSYTSQITTPATCTDAGIKTYTCTCGDSYTEEIVAAGHVEVTVGTEDIHSKCDTCEVVLSSSHSYEVQETQAATCTDDGVNTHICSCGYSYTTVVDAIGHTERTSTTSATCTTDGKTTVSCSVCREIISETEIPATGHVKGSEASIAYCMYCSETLILLDANNFPDSAFLQYIDVFNTDNDDMLTQQEIALIKTIDVSSKGVTDLTGITYFTALETLDCKNNTRLSSLNVRGLSLLNTVDVSGTSLSEIKLDFDTSNHNVTYLVAQNCESLETISLNSTSLKTLDIAGSDNVESIDLSISQIENLDLSGKTSLTKLNASSCISLSKLNLTGCTALTDLKVEGCYQLQTLNVTNCSSLTQLDTSTCTQLQYFTITGSGLE